VGIGLRGVEAIEPAHAAVILAHGIIALA
jgi:hypothetical protein